MMKKVMVLISILLAASTPNGFAAGESIGSLSHIHSVRAVGNQIILGTHEGLYQYVDEKTVKRMGPERFDVMGLAVSNKGFYASGHPGPGSKLPEPVGLLLTTDRGATWKKVSLTGQVDFHTLETAGEDIYGADSGSGQLMYSGNGGKSWVKRGPNTFMDIAPDPTTKGTVLGVTEGKLFRSTDAFKTSKLVKTTFTVESIDWIKGSLIASSGKVLYRSTDSGSSWKKIATLPSQIGTITQSSQLIAVVMGSAIYSSNNGGKSFKKYQSK
jgi:photosystem II stability/assembly factor-like uncharacterized protein